LRHCDRLELFADFGLDDWSLLSTPGIARVVDLAVATSPSAERLGVSFNPIR
jgi:hypothetical protein